VNGAWAFVHGSEPTADALVVSARNAVATAKGYSGRYGGQQGLSPAPAVRGEWITPIQLDPFTVPLYDQADLLWSLRSASRTRMAGAMVGGFEWTHETRVFASTEGSLVTQVFYRSEPSVAVGAGIPAGTEASVSQPMLWPQAGGYECVTAADLQDRIKSAAEDAAELASLPLRRLDVGRYPIVMDGTSLGATLVQTLGVAFGLPRVLGDEVGGSGTSYLSPPERMIGSTVTSPVLTITADRPVPDITGRQWDDEGVEAKPFTLVEHGQLRGYIASRRSVAALADAAPTLSSSIAGTGCAQAYLASWPVEVVVPRLSILPAASHTSVRDLCREIDHGLLLRYNQDKWQSDSTLTSGFKTCDRDGNVFEIVNGKIVSRLHCIGLQFSTPRFWRSLKTLGGADTVAPAAVSTLGGDRRTTTWQSASAPAGLFNEIDVINTRPQQ
jgi:TldD protein